MGGGGEKVPGQYVKFSIAPSRLHRLYGQLLTNLPSPPASLSPPISPILLTTFV
jgi:hypothetical protein